MRQLRVLINGAYGRMGQEACKAVEETMDLLLVAKAGKEDNLVTCINNSNPDIVIDLTIADVVYKNAKTIIENNIHPVIGTTGLLPEQITALQQVCHEKKLGGIIAPNFSLAVSLMIKYAQDAAHYLPNVEIIEQHHDQKRDAPSGTAIKTAEIIAKGRQTTPKMLDEQEIIEGARGAKYHDIPIHSVRLPGLVAHQSIIFGNLGETLTFRHDSTSRQCFMPGIILACRKVIEMKELIYGLEHLI